MHESLSIQLQKLFNMYTASEQKIIKHERYFALPNGGVTTNREEAREAWEIRALMRNVRNCNVAGDLKYCY